MSKYSWLKRGSVITMAAAFALGMAGCGASNSVGTKEENTQTEEQETVLIAAAASLEAVLENVLIPQFEEANPGVKVEGTYAGSGDLQSQIESGLEADVFLSAATSNMDALVEEGLVDGDSVTELLKNDVVLIVPEGVESKVTGFEDLAEADVVAIGNPDSVPAGKYAKEILTGLGIYDAVAEKASFGNNVTEVCTWVAEGSADAGIVYATDARTENLNGDDKKVAVLAVAQDSMMETPVIYPMGTVAASSKKDSAKLLEDFLQSEEAEKAFTEAGFTMAK